MIVEKGDAHSSFKAGLTMNPIISLEQAMAHGRYEMRCFDRYGNLKWDASGPNVVCTQGKTRALEVLFGGVASFTWYFDLIISTGTPVAGDTLQSHAGWTAATPGTTWTGTNRPTGTWGAAAAGSKALTSAASFTINTTVTIYGALLCSAQTTAGDAAGYLWSAGTFTSRACVATDILNVSYTTGL